MAACTETENVEATVFVQETQGLHARPAARLAMAAQSFQSDVTLELKGRRVNAKSILGILSLAAGRGASLTISCHGPDAREASNSLQELFSQSFFSEKS